jgi:predicted dehydrogenase
MAHQDALTIGLIGTGGIMDWHIGNLLKIPNVTIGALADPAAANLEKTKQRRPELANASTYADHRDLLRNSRVDAVVIGSRHVDHGPQVLDALHAGCHVLVEKPFVGSVAQAKQAIALAKKAKKTLMISYQRHFDPKFRLLRKIVQDGRIGRVQTISSSLGQFWLEGTKGSWRQDPKLSLGGQLNDSGSHIQDIALWITGLKPVEVFAHLDNRGSRVDINSAVSIRLEQDVMWTISVSGNTPGFWEYLLIGGDKGAIFYQNGDVWLTEGSVRSKLESFGQYHDQDAGFIKAVRGETPNEVPGEFGLLVTALTQAAFKSGASKKPVRIRL